MIAETKTNRKAGNMLTTMTRPEGRMICMWGNGNGEGYAEMVRPEAEAGTAGAYLPADMKFTLETHDYGATWTPIQADVWPIMDL